MSVNTVSVNGNLQTSVIRENGGGNINMSVAASSTSGCSVNIAQIAEDWRVKCEPGNGIHANDTVVQEYEADSSKVHDLLSREVFNELNQQAVVMQADVDSEPWKFLERGLSMPLPETDQLNPMATTIQRYMDGIRMWNGATLQRKPPRCPVSRIGHLLDGQGNGPRGGRGHGGRRGRGLRGGRSSPRRGALLGNSVRYSFLQNHAEEQRYPGTYYNAVPFLDTRSSLLAPAVAAASPFSSNIDYTMTTTCKPLPPAFTNIQATYDVALPPGMAPQEVQQEVEVRSIPHSQAPLNDAADEYQEHIDAYIEKFPCHRTGSERVINELVTPDASQRPTTLQEAIAKYIDFLVLENELRTRISDCRVIKIANNFDKESYYHDVMYRPVCFPTHKFRNWLRLYSVDVEIINPEGAIVSETTFPPSGVTPLSYAHQSVAGLRRIAPRDTMASAAAVVQSKEIETRGRQRGGRKSKNYPTLGKIPLNWKSELSRPQVPSSIPMLNSHDQRQTILRPRDVSIMPRPPQYPLVHSPNYYLPLQVNKELLSQHNSPNYCPPPFLAPPPTLFFDSKDNLLPYLHLNTNSGALPLSNELQDDNHFSFQYAVHPMEQRSTYVSNAPQFIPGQKSVDIHYSNNNRNAAPQPAHCRIYTGVDSFYGRSQVKPEDAIADQKFIGYKISTAVQEVQEVDSYKRVPDTPAVPSGPSKSYKRGPDTPATPSGPSKTYKRVPDTPTVPAGPSKRLMMLQAMHLARTKTKPVSVDRNQTEAVNLSTVASEVRREGCTGMVNRDGRGNGRWDGGRGDGRGDKHGSTSDNRSMTAIENGMMCDERSVEEYLVPSEMVYCGTLVDECMSSRDSGTIYDMRIAAAVKVDENQNTIYYENKESGESEMSKEICSSAGSHFDGITPDKGRSSLTSKMNLGDEILVIEPTYEVVSDLGLGGRITPIVNYSQCSYGFNASSPDVVPPPQNWNASSQDISTPPCSTLSSCRRLESGESPTSPERRGGGVSVLMTLDVALPTYHLE